MKILNDITLGQYYPVDSFIHRLDPRTKVLVVFMTMMMFILWNQLLGFLIALIVLFLIVNIARIPIALVARNLRPFIWLFLITILLHLFLTSKDGGVFLIPIIGIELPTQGLRLGVLYSLRLAVLIIIAALLTLTTSPMELTDAMERFLKPLQKLGISTHEFTMMITLSLRFIPTLIFEADKLQKAQVSRGARFEGNIVQRIKSVIPLILPLFISVFRRADELALAMDARCYIGGRNRTSFKKLVFHRHDYFVLAGALIVYTAAIVFATNVFEN
ncbi:MAG: energy-coupling factor transporter transmembrane component T family protein [Candidatus Zhuqueibacterota bacterium]